MNHTCAVFEASPVHAAPVEGFRQRLRFALEHRLIYPIFKRDGGIVRAGQQLLSDVVCTRWMLFRLSNGASFVVPGEFPRFHVYGPGGGRILLSAEAAGIAISLAVLEMAMQDPKRRGAASMHLIGLFDYVSWHPEALAIHAALTVWCERYALQRSFLRWCLDPFLAFDPEREHSRGEAPLMHERATVVEQRVMQQE